VISLFAKPLPQLFQHCIRDRASFYKVLFEIGHINISGIEKIIIVVKGS